MPDHPEKAALCRYLDALAAAGFVPTHVDNGGDEWVLTLTREAVLYEALATDGASIRFNRPGVWIFVVYGNSPAELINDYSAGHPVFEAVIESVSETFDNEA